MKINFKLLTLFLAITTLINCKQKKTLSNYKYSDKSPKITCSNSDTKLYNEALYSFEKDIFNFYVKGETDAYQVEAYNQFLRDALNNDVPIKEIISSHTIEIFEVLKNESHLWNKNAPNLNYNSNLVKCISSNIEDANLKSTFNALISTNTMSFKLFGPALITKYIYLNTDKFLATFIAFDLFYAKLFDIDFSKVNLNKVEQKADFNQVPEE